MPSLLPSCPTNNSDDLKRVKWTKTRNQQNKNVNCAETNIIIERGCGKLRFDAAATASGRGKKVTLEPAFSDSSGREHFISVSSENEEEVEHSLTTDMYGEREGGRPIYPFPGHRIHRRLQTANGIAWLLHPQQTAPSQFPPFSQSVRGILLPARAPPSTSDPRGGRETADPLLDRIFLGLEVTVSIPFWRRPPWAFGQEGGPLAAGLPPQRKCESFRESYESIIIISREIFCITKQDMSRYFDSR